MIHYSKALRLPAVFVLAAVSVISCITVDKSLGSGNIPDDQKLKMETASFNIPVDLKMADSLQGASTSYLMVGAINTAEMGLAQFSTAANIVPYYTGTRYGQDPVIISTYIVFVKSASVTMEDNQDGITQDIFVYRLKQPLDTINVYNNSINSSSYYPTPLNNKAITYYGGDTLKIYLNNSLGKELLTATDTELDSLNLFSKRFGGLYVKSSTPPAGIIGGRLNQFSYGDTYLYLKYNFQPTWKSGMARKDTTVVMSFGYKFCLNLSSYSTANKETTDAEIVFPVGEKDIEAVRRRRGLRRCGHRRLEIPVDADNEIVFLFCDAETELQRRTDQNRQAEQKPGRGHLGFYKMHLDSPLNCP